MINVKSLLVVSLTLLIGACLTATAHARPTITGKPVIDRPPLLAWPSDQGTLEPNLDDNTANTVNDLHSRIDDCDLVLSTEGNYHPALHDIWPVFLAQFKGTPLHNWLYTTSPPVVLSQLAHGQLQFGNFTTTCRPSVAIANKGVIDQLVNEGLAEGAPVALYRDRGSVLLVKHGNPKHIRSVWDLVRDDVRVVTPNPEIEKGAFITYADTLYGIASQDDAPPAGQTADRLFNSLFNSRLPLKWLAGERIHHRNLPWSIAYGRADAGVIYSHLARYIVAAFPELFDVVPLGGTIDNPQPLPGSRINTRYMVRIKGPWNARQLEARETLFATLLSSAFTEVLVRRGLARPEPTSLVDTRP